MAIHITNVSIVNILLAFCFAAVKTEPVCDLLSEHSITDYTFTLFLDESYYFYIQAYLTQGRHFVYNCGSFNTYKYLWNHSHNQSKEQQFITQTFLCSL